MKKVVLLPILLFWLNAILLAQTIPQDSLYLGQTLPGNTPVVFNLPINNGLRPIERIAISTDGRELYFGLLDTYPPNIQKTYCYKYQNDTWQGPFNLFENHMAPRLSANDSTIYMLNNCNDFSTTYFSVKGATAWSLPQKLLNTTQQTHYYQTTGLGNAYLSSNLLATPTQRDICKLNINGSDTLIQSLGLPINTTYDENDLYVADDESYLIFSRNKAGGGDMYLSFKKNNGKWTNPKKFDEPINHPGSTWEYGMFVSKDKQYLFYTSGGTTMSTYYTYWVKIDNIIDSMKLTNYTPYLNTAIPNQECTIGCNYNYTFPDTTFMDDDGNNTLTYSATLSNGSALPSWLNFDPLTRTFMGTPTCIGDYTIKVIASDTANATAFCIFNLKILNTVGNESDNKHGNNGYRLYQNNPNPFYLNTAIEFSLPQHERVWLGVYDATGTLRKNVFEGELNTGMHRFEFDASGLAAGAYFCVLKTNSFFDKKKMMVFM